MDNFREWLSDNLRYILLGIFILAVLGVLFLGVRFVSSKLSSNETADVKTEENAADGDTTQQEQEQATGEGADAQAATLEKGKYPEVETLIQTYYTALGSHDITGIQSVVDTLDDETKESIEADTAVDSYDGVETYTVKGSLEGSYVVFAKYNIHFSEIDASVPGLSQLYVCSDEEGRLYIATQEQDEETQTYLQKVQERDDVQELVAEVNEAYEKTLADNQRLNDYINGLGEESAEESGEVDTEE